MEKHSFDAVNSYAETKYEYDLNGNVKKKSVKNNSAGTTNNTYAVTVNTYDKMNNLTKTSITDSGKTYYTAYEYDGAGNMTAVKAANGENITTYGYNTLDQLTSMKDPEGGMEQYSYDVRGNMTSKTLRSGTTIRYSYDAADRFTGEYVSSAGSAIIKSNIDYDRNNNGILTKTETNSNGAITTTIDKYGRTTVRNITSNGQTYGIGYNYNAQNLVDNKYVYKKDEINHNTYYADYKYSYDPMSRLTKVMDADNSDAVVFCQG